MVTFNGSELSMYNKTDEKWENLLLLPEVGRNIPQLQYIISIKNCNNYCYEFK